MLLDHYHLKIANIIRRKQIERLECKDSKTSPILIAFLYRLIPLTSYMFSINKADHPMTSPNTPNII
jgi:hypothetical protein